jgi:flagella basal body P-ring formation protein FlgA
MLKTFKNIKLQNVKKSIAKRLFCTGFTVALAVASPIYAEASNIALLKSDAYISDSVITVGDIFENAGPHANHVLAPAPKVGETKIIGMNDLMRIKKAFDLNWTPQGKYEKIVLKRATTSVEKSEIARLVEASVLKKLPSDKVELSIKTPLPRMTFDGHKKPTIKVKDAHYDSFKNEFTVNLDIKGQNGPSKELTVEGQVFQLTDIPVLSENMRNGDLIRENDVHMMTVRQNDINEAVFLSKNDLIGMTPRRTLREGQPVRLSDLEKPKIVKKGEIITITLKNGPLNLTAKGKAMDHGAKGDIIRVMNTTSKRVIEGQVNAPQRVIVARN